jgi:uncharacterized membrane protein
MTMDLKRPSPRLGFDGEDRRALAIMAGGAILIIPTAAWLFGGVQSGGAESLRLVPDLAPLIHARPVVLAHLAAGLTAVALGVAVLIRRKGGRTHRLAGRLWAGLMLGAAISGMAIDIHRFTPAHGAALFVFWMIPSVIVKVRRGDLRGHRRGVAYLLIALVIVTGLSFLPGHLLHGVIFEPA